MDNKLSFSEKLDLASQKNNSLLCVGLDPDPEMILPDTNNVVAFNRLIIKATVDLACAYKPNLAIYESMGMEGLSALQKTLDFIRQADSDIPIIGDGKRGDIGTCSLAYAKTLLENYNFDAVTVNPYMGSDAIRPFLEYEDKGVFVLCRTSNPSGKEIQELMVVQDGVNRPIYEIVAELALSWNMNGNVGLVVGATYPEQILHVREICPNMLFLIPGVGAQGGSIEKTVRSAADAEGRGFIINVSRQIMYAAKTHTGKRSGDSEAVKIRKMRLVARQLKDEINRCLPIPLKKTPKQTRRDHEDQILRGEPYQQTESSVVAISGR